MTAGVVGTATTVTSVLLDLVGSPRLVAVISTLPAVPGAVQAPVPAVITPLLTEALLSSTWATVSAVAWMPWVTFSR